MADLISMLLAAAGNQGPTNTEVYGLGSGNLGGLDKSLNAATASNDRTVVKPTLYYGPWNTWSKNVPVNSSQNGFLVRNDGTLWCFGQDSSGSSGLNTSTVSGSNILFLTRVGTTTDWLNAKISVGNLFTIAVKSNGTLWSWGAGADGKTGQGDVVARSSPVQVGALTNWANVYAGTSYWIATKTDGTLWACGLNDFGQLGLGDRVSRSSPVQVGALTDWNGSGLAAGYRTSFVVKSDGTLWGWGENTVGAIGTNNRTNRSSPVQVGALTDWSKVYTSVQNTYAIKTDGTLWAWGSNGFGQIGTNNLTNRSSPVQVGALTNWQDISIIEDDITTLPTQVAGIESGKLYKWGNTGWLASGIRSSPVQVGSRTDWIALAHKVVSSNIFIAKSNSTAAAVLGFYSNKNTPVSFSEGFTANEGNYVFPAVQVGFPVPVESSSDWISVGAGYYSGFGIKADNTLWVWGAGDSGQLGTNNSTSYSSPVQVGALTDWSKVFGARGVTPTTFAVKTDGTLWAMGSNSQGKAGNNVNSGTVSAYSSPIQIGALTNWKKAFSNADATLMLKTDGTIWYCGLNQDGIWGANTGSVGRRSSPVQMGAVTTWDDLSLASFSAAAAIRTDGTLWTWGKNDDHGNLGIGNRVNRSAPTQVSGTWSKVIMGRTAMGIKSDGTLWTWGTNEFGALGINLSQSGANLARSSPVQVGALTNWTNISISGSTMYALNSDNDLYTWGIQTLPTSSASWNFSTVTVAYSSPVQIANIKITEMTYGSTVANFLKSNV